MNDSTLVIVGVVILAALTLTISNPVPGDEVPVMMMAAIFTLLLVARGGHFQIAEPFGVEVSA